MDRIDDILTIVSFLIGALKPTPEGRARRALIRAQRAREKSAKKRRKYEREIRKDWVSGDLTKQDYIDLMKDYDRSQPSQNLNHEIPSLPIGNIKPCANNCAGDVCNACAP